MAFWEIDLTSRVGAQGATHLGSMGAFGFAGLAILGIVIGGGMAGFDTPEGMGIAIGAGVEAVVALVAGFRFRQDKGAFWGMAAAALLAVELITKLVTLSGLGAGLIISTVLLVCMVQGVRGALALRRSTGFADDEAEVFE